MEKTILFLILFGLAAIQAQTLTVTTYAYFDSIIGGKNRKNCRPAGEIVYGGPNDTVSCESYKYTTPPNSQGRWGNAATYENSGLGYQGILNSAVPVNTDFYLGALTHYNFPISSDSVASAINLNIVLIIRNSGGTLITQSIYPFTMLIDETPNTNGTCVYPSITPCADRISFQSSFVFDRSFTVNGISYTLKLQGFKESDQSQSSAIAEFISNESAARVGYLFARITAACPATCVNGGTVSIDSNNNCVCTCPSSACPSFMTPTSTCSCVCPPKTCLREGTINPTTCGCVCPACPTPKILNSVDCSCNCPTTSCVAGVLNTDTCGCDCNGLAPCAQANQVRSSTCECVCNLTCPAGKIRNPSSSICGCVCSSTPCQNSYFTKDPNSCDCVCSRTCQHSSVVVADCSCGPCQGNWTKNVTTGDCTTCGISASQCTGQEVFDPVACKCVCGTVTCDIRAGLVRDEASSCACRPCRAGECICGNGILEPGEQCENGTGTFDQCCQKCKFVVAACSDGNPCTTGDVCTGLGIGSANCVGNYNCPLPTECQSSVCDPIRGCVVVQKANGTACGSKNLCLERCLSGLCTASPVTCAADNNTQDCFVPQCQNTTGMCTPVPISGTGCNDGIGCTFNDICRNGVCSGTPVVCQQSNNTCVNITCEAGNCVPKDIPNGTPCDYDGSLCTVGDACVHGVCYSGVPTVCNATNVCNSGSCDPLTGRCGTVSVPNSLNQTCDDKNLCTTNDRCQNGTCQGDVDPSLSSPTGLAQCGAPVVTPPKSVSNNSIIIFSAAGGAALIGAIAGLAFLLKRIRDKKLLDADTWNPDTFSSVGSNPLYKGSEKSVDNRLYEGSM